jgi:hypothetical protein
MPMKLRGEQGVPFRSFELQTLISIEPLGLRMVELK